MLRTQKSGSAMKNLKKHAGKLAIFGLAAAAAVSAACGEAESPVSKKDSETSVPRIESIAESPVSKKDSETSVPRIEGIAESPVSKKDSETANQNYSEACDVHEKYSYVKSQADLTPDAKASYNELFGSMNDVELTKYYHKIARDFIKNPDSDHTLAMFMGSFYLGNEFIRGTENSEQSYFCQNEPITDQTAFMGKKLASLERLEEYDNLASRLNGLDDDKVKDLFELGTLVFLRNPENDAASYNASILTRYVFETYVLEVH